MCYFFRANIIIIIGENGGKDKDKEKRKTIHIIHSGVNNKKRFSRINSSIATNTKDRH
jgi:hypothetical protein